MLSESRQDIPPIKRSLSAKLTIAYSILIIFISAALAFALYFQLNQQQEQAIRGRLTDILNFSVPLINGSVHALISANTPTTNPSYRLMTSTLSEIRSNSPIIRDVFTLRQQSSGTYIYIVDSSNADEELHVAGTSFTDSIHADLASALDARSPVVETSLLRQNGEDLLRGYIPIFDEFNQLNGLLVVDIDAASIAASRIQATVVAALTFFITAPIAMGIGWFISRTLLAPIGDLTAATQRMMSGQLRQPVTIRSQDELGILAYTFNNMSTELDNLYSTLEQRVRDRTVQFVEARKQAEEASQAKSHFLSNMSHELRTPLNVLIGYSNAMINRPQMFDDTVLPDIFKRYIALIEENGHYLLSLINDILDLSKIEAGKLDLHQTTVTLPDLLRGVIATTTGLVKDRSVQLRPDFSDDLPPVWADSMRLRQIILNLMSNAIKFTDSGSVTLSAQQKGNFVTISVTDTGIGIPEDALALIFDRFAQVEQGKHGGTGLGLDISKQLVLMHGGDLTVESKVNQGSTFSFTIPLASAEQIENDKDIEIVETANLTIFSGNTTGIDLVPQMRVVLLVDDDAAMRNLVHRLLESIDYVVMDLAEGSPAQDMAKTIQPDVIILDAQLPDITGWEVLKALKADPETALLPVIFYTADLDYRRSKELGAVRSLQKPVSPNQLLEVVQEVVNLGPVGALQKT